MLRARLASATLSVACSCCLFAAAASARAEAGVGALSNAIVRGVAAGDELPALAAILLEEESASEQLLATVCSGTLIAADVILTAGHCIAHYGPEHAPLGTRRSWFVSFQADLRGIEQTLKLPEDAIEVRSTLIHPEFAERENQRIGLGPSHDVGLVFLEHPVRDRAPIPLLPAGAPALRVGADVLIAGYGSTSENGLAASSAEGVGLKTYGHGKVLEVGSHELRAGRPISPRTQYERSLADICEGDSGGPLLVAWDDVFVIAGVTSRGYDAHESCESAGVELRIDLVRPWIVENVALVDAMIREDAASCAAVAGQGDDGLRRHGWMTALFTALLVTARLSVRLHKRGRIARARADSSNTRPS